MKCRIPRSPKRRQRAIQIPWQRARCSVWPVPLLQKTPPQGLPSLPPPASSGISGCSISYETKGIQPSLTLIQNGHSAGLGKRLQKAGMAMWSPELPRPRSSLSFLFGGRGSSFLLALSPAAFVSSTNSNSNSPVLTKACHQCAQLSMSSTTTK